MKNNCRRNALILISAAIIAYQLGLMQILSISQWYHFAYMIISVALLGFGVAGTVLALFKERLLAQSARLLPLLLTASGLGMAGILYLYQFPFIRFDSLLLFTTGGQFGRLILTYLLFLLPFFLGALAVGIIFVAEVARIGRVYFANLLGSGLGALLGVLLLQGLEPPVIPAAVALLAVAAGGLLSPPKSDRLLLAGQIAALLTCAAGILLPAEVPLSQFKDRSKILLLPEARIVYRQPGAYGWIEVVSSPALRYAPAVSLTYRGEVPVAKQVLRNGDGIGVILPWQRSDTTTILDWTTRALPFALRRPQSVLVLDAGTGTAVAQAVSNGAGTVVAVEKIAALPALLQNKFSIEVDSLFQRPEVTCRQLDSRTFLLTDTARYDLILLPEIGVFGGNSGLFALQEQYLLTREAFRDLWARLSPRGMISVTAWIDYPPRNPLKILALLMEMLEAQKVRDPEVHLVAIRSWGTITFVATKTPLRKAEIAQVRELCARLQFDPALLPGLRNGERVQYHALQDARFLKFVDEIVNGDRAALYDRYDFNISPPDDGRPFFSQFLRWQHLPALARQFGRQTLPFFETGYLIVVVTLLQITLISVVLILLPLWKTVQMRGRKWPVFTYFSGIALGYMFVEMVLIQQFVLYFGNPVYAAAMVISALLIFSGAGSYASEQWPPGRRFWVVPLLIALFLVGYALWLPEMLRQTIARPLFFKYILAMGVLAPPAVLMGMPFPVGLKRISRRGLEGSAVPWAWGINGCVSVISTALATIAAVEVGFGWVMIFAAGGYLWTLPALKKMAPGRHRDSK